MFCPKCGANLPDGTTFCTSCGQPLAPQQAAPQQPVYQQPYQQQPYQQQAYQQPGYQQPYQQPQPAYKPPVEELPTQPFTTKGVLDTLLYNIKQPRLWGIPQFITFGGVFMVIMSMIMPFISGFNYFKIMPTSFILATFFLLVYVCFASFTKNGFVMMSAGAIMTFFTIFRGAAMGGSLSAGFVFMLLSSLAILGAGIYQYVLEQKKQ